MMEQYKPVQAQSVSHSPSRKRYEPEARAGFGHLTLMQYGLDDIKETAAEFRDQGLGAQNDLMLLSGPPGVGKTTLA
jgi:DNA replication protein DnaC